MENQSSSWVEHAQNMLEKINTLQKSKVYPMVDFWKTKEPGWYKSDDARVYCFIGLARATNNLKLSYLFFSQCGDIRWWKELDISAESTEVIIQDWLREYEVFIGWAYILNIWTNIEETFRLIWTAQGKNASEKIGFIYNKILKEAGHLFYSPLLDIWRLLKNVHHNNGVYMPESGQDKIVNWKGVDYHFKVGADIQFYSPQLIVDTLTADLCDVMNRVIMSKPILDLSSVPRPSLIS